MWDGLYQALQMHGRTIPPALSVSGRNDLLAFARQELPEDAYMQLITYADELSRSLPHTRDVGFPPQIADMENIRHPAEEYAWTLLDEGRGSLWHAIRAIATLLPFDRCARRSASSPHMAFAAGAYGHHGYVGMHHHTQLMPRVCRLFNRFIFSICPDHRWTSFQVLCDSLLDMHIDSQNAKLDSFMIGISYFSEGAVWVQDSQGLDFEDVRGQLMPGRLLDLCCRGYMVPTYSRPHGSRSWQHGNRFILISYAIGAHRQLKSEQRTELYRLGFMPPPLEDS